MYCLDTNIIIDILRGNKKIIQEINKIWNKNIFVTSITACELYKGAYGHKNPENKIKIIKEFLQNINIISEDHNSCQEFGLMWQTLKKKGNQIGDFDVIIASIVKSNNLILVTQDKLFKKLDLEIQII